MASIVALMRSLAMDQELHVQTPVTTRVYERECEMTGELIIPSGTRFIKNNFYSLPCRGLYNVDFKIFPPVKTTIATYNGKVTYTYGSMSVMTKNGNVDGVTFDGQSSTGDLSYAIGSKKFVSSLVRADNVSVL